MSNPSDKYTREELRQMARAQYTVRLIPGLPKYWHLAVPEYGSVQVAADGRTIMVEALITYTLPEEP